MLIGLATDPGSVSWSCIDHDRPTACIVSLLWSHLDLAALAILLDVRRLYPSGCMWEVSDRRGLLRSYYPLKRSNTGLCTLGAYLYY